MSAIPIHFFNIPIPLSSVSFKTLPSLSKATTLVTDFALKYFAALRQSVLLILGGLAISKSVRVFVEVSWDEDEKRVRRAAWQFFEGCLLLVSGITGLISKFNYLSAGCVTSWNRQMATYGNSFFLFSNLVAIKNSIDLYNSATDTAAQQQAILKLMSALAYAIASLFQLFTTATEVITALFIIGFLTACFEYLHPYIS